MSNEDWYLNTRRGSKIACSDLAYSLVSEIIFLSADIVSRLLAGVKTWVLAERLSHAAHPHRAAIPVLVGHLLRHHQYAAVEKEYVGITQSFYRQESAEKAESLKDEPRVFFEQACTRISEESARVEAVLPVSAWSLVRTATENALWGGRVEWICKTSKRFYIRFGELLAEFH